MNSQDKPIDANDNLDESLETANASKQEDKNSVDLWTGEDEDAEIVTEFISAETAAKNDAEALSEIIFTNYESKPKKQKNINLDLDDWDFRNPPAVDSNSVESELELELDSVYESIALAAELESKQSQELELLADEPAIEISLDSSSDLEVDDLGTLESLNDELIAEIALDDLNEPALTFDSSSDLELDGLGLSELDDLQSLDVYAV